MKPSDCSTAVLNLCVRKRPRTPSPEKTYSHHNQTEKDYFNSCASSLSTIMLSTSSENSTDTSDLSRDLAKVKTYLKNPLALALSVAPPDILDGSSAEAYAEFRNRMLATAKQNYSSTNKNMRRTIYVNSPQKSDPTYWEKRKKNNEAAKRSRDARKVKEDEIAIRCAFLEQENVKLRNEIARIRYENERYSALLYKRL